MNIIQRRKFINAIHDPIATVKDDHTAKKLREHPYHPQQLKDDESTNRLTDNVHHLPLGFFIPGPSEYYSRYKIAENDDHAKDIEKLQEADQLSDIDDLTERDHEIKHVLVMSDKEQEALARLDSIISQLHITRNLIRRRWFVFC